MALVWDKALFDELYGGYGWRWGVRDFPRKPMFRYHWFAQKDRLADMAAVMLSRPGFAQVSHLAIIGGGFGWLSEILEANGVTIVNVDTSPYIQAEKGNSEEADLRTLLTAQGFDPDNLPDLMSPTNPNVPVADPWTFWLRPTRSIVTIMDEDLSNNSSRNSVKRELSNNMDGILTEFVLDGMTTDAEALEVAERAEQLRPNPSVPVIHLVNEGVEGDLRMLNKTLADWRVLLDTNGFAQHVLVDQHGTVL